VDSDHRFCGNYSNGTNPQMNYKNSTRFINCSSSFLGTSRLFCQLSQLSKGRVFMEDLLIEVDGTMPTAGRFVCIGIVITLNAGISST
jgi:hypothetical protein